MNSKASVLFSSAGSLGQSAKLDGVPTGLSAVMELAHSGLALLPDAANDVRRKLSDRLSSPDPGRKCSGLHDGGEHGSAEGTHFTLTVRPRSTVFLVGAGARTQQLVTDALAEGWGLDPTKAQGLAPDDNAFYIRLKNRPFLEGIGARNRAKISRTLCDCVQRLRTAGWQLLTSVDLTNQYPASTLFFRRTSPQQRPPPADGLACLAISEGSLLSLVDGTEAMESCFTEVTASRQSSSPPPRPRNSGDDDGPSVRLRGFSFQSDNRSDSLQSLQLILELVRGFDRCGHRPYGTLNLACASDSLLFARKSPDAPPGRFISLSLHLSNRLRLIDAPEQVLRAVLDRALVTGWPPGVDRVNDDGRGVTEIRLAGQPWNPVGDEYQQARLFLCNALSVLAETGWRCVLSYDASRNTYDKAVLVLAEQPPVRLDVFCLNLSAGMRCQLIQAPDEVGQCFARAVADFWPKPALQEILHPNGVREWELNARPWSWNKGYDTHARALVSGFIDQCGKRGWNVLAAANILAKYDLPNDACPRDAHCIFFEKCSALQDEADG